MARKKLTAAERERFRIEREQTDLHIRQLRELAERAQAKLDAAKPRGTSA
jgi:hypothetical protein